MPRAATAVPDYARRVRFAFILVGPLVAAALFGPPIWRALDPEVAIAAHLGCGEGDSYIPPAGTPLPICTRCAAT